MLFVTGVPASIDPAGSAGESEGLEMEIMADEQVRLTVFQCLFSLFGPREASANLEQLHDMGECLPSGSREFAFQPGFWC